MKRYQHVFPNWLTYAKWRYVNKVLRHAYYRSLQTMKVYVRYL